MDPQMASAFACLSVQTAASSALVALAKPSPAKTSRSGLDRAPHKLPNSARHARAGRRPLPSAPSDDYPDCRLLHSRRGLVLEPRRRLVQPGRAARRYMVVAAIPAAWIRSDSDLPATARHRRQPRHHGHHVAVLCAQGAGCQHGALLPPLQRDHGAREHLVPARRRARAAPEAALSGLAASAARRPRGRA
eukprot:scaffold18534_cov67-Phaeocystis_antarctica.AAC.3